MASRVVPAKSVTMERSLPNRAFKNEDLPALGLPKMATRGTPASGFSMPSSLKFEIMASNISPVPEPLSAAIG